MYQLLVKYMPWSPEQDSMPIDRTLEYTESNLVAHFKPNGVLNTPRLVELPALFACETGGRGEQVARVGTIYQMNSDNREVTFRYTIDSLIPPITNSILENLAPRLAIDQFEFSRTHWAVKHVDLFKVLLEQTLRQKPANTVFNLPLGRSPEPNLVSVMMPFDSKFDLVFETIKQTSAQMGLKCERADNIWDHHAVIQDIVSLISRSRVVICDCSSRNANVFYEAGIAHTLDRDVILIAQADEDVPFDLRHLRYAKYLNNSEGRADLCRQIQARLRSLLTRII